MDKGWNTVPVTDGGRFFVPKSHGIRRALRCWRWRRMKRHVESVPPRARQPKIIDVSVLEVMFVICGLMFSIAFEVGTLVMFVWNCSI